MLLMLTMLPRPLAAIPGANAATRMNGARTLLANILSNAETSNSAVGPQTEIPAFVDQDVDLADVACQAPHVGGIAEVGGDEAGLAAGGSDFFDRVGAACGVAAVNQDLRPIPGQLQRHRATDAGRPTRHQRPLPFEVVLTHG
jgi:hypothetical protein